MSCKADLGHWYGKIIVDGMDRINVDINETEIFNLYPEVLETLLKDHTTGRNIFWATDSYAHRGDGFQYSDARCYICTCLALFFIFGFTQLFEYQILQFHASCFYRIWLGTDHKNRDI